MNTPMQRYYNHLWHVSMLIFICYLRYFGSKVHKLSVYFLHRWLLKTIAEGLQCDH